MQRTGVDPECHRGESAYDRYYGDPRVTPNPCLGPVIKPPFYAVRLDPGDFGTQGGMVINADAQVVREDGSLIGWALRLRQLQRPHLALLPGSGLYAGAVDDLRLPGRQVHYRLSRTECELRHQ